MMRAARVVLIPCGVLLLACDEDQQPPAVYPAVAVQPADTAAPPPPPIFVSTTSGTCDDTDASGCENRCGDGDAQACERLRRSYVQYTAAPTTRVDVSGAAQVVQFFGPVQNVYIGQPAPHR